MHPPPEGSRELLQVAQVLHSHLALLEELALHVLARGLQVRDLLGKGAAKQCAGWVRGRDKDSRGLRRNIPGTHSRSSIFAFAAAVASSQARRLPATSFSSAAIAADKALWQRNHNEPRSASK